MSQARHRGGPIAFQSPSVHRDDTWKPLEIHTGERAWYVVGYSGRTSHEPNIFPKNSRVHSRSVVGTVASGIEWSPL